MSALVSSSLDGGAFVAVGIPGQELGRETAEVLRQSQPGAIVLFARNIGGAEQLRALIGDLRRVVPGALLAVDAEGGRVDRLAAVVGPAPAAARLAQLPAGTAQAAGEWIGRALRLFGFDLDFAPVVDLDRGEQRNALDGRYFGADPAAVVARSRAFLKGLHGSGVGGCLKHFPGLGGATVDTHHGMARIALGEADLAPDRKPFAELATLAGAVMIGHALYAAYDTEHRPASLSPVIATRLLRQRLGFRGLSVADDLEMNALAQWGDLPARAEAAFAAGCDLLPVCAHVEILPEIASRLEAARLAGRRKVAARRLERYRQRLVELRAAEGAPRKGFAEELAAVRRGLAELAASGAGDAPVKA